MSDNKKRPKPAPTSYTMKSEIDMMKKSEKQASTSEKTCAFIEHAKWEGGLTPGHKYNQNIDMSFKKERTARMFPENPKSKDRRIEKIVVDKSILGPGEYNTYDAWRKT